MNHTVSFLYKYTGVSQTLPEKAELLQMATALLDAKACSESHGICRERVICHKFRSPENLPGLRAVAGVTCSVEPPNRIQALRKTSSLCKDFVQNAIVLRSLWDVDGQSCLTRDCLWAGFSAIVSGRGMGREVPFPLYRSQKSR